MNYNNFKSQCETFLPNQGCTDVNVDNFLSLKCLTYRCTFNYKGSLYTIHCNSFGQWSLSRGDTQIASVGHLYIDVLWERSGL